MADSFSSSNDSLTINNDKSIHECNSKNCSTNEKLTVTIFANGKKAKCKMTPEHYQQLTDKLLEMEQIKCEERFVHEQINRIISEKQHLKNLLNMLHTIDSNDRIKNSHFQQQRLKKLNSN